MKTNELYFRVKRHDHWQSLNINELTPAELTEALKHHDRDDLLKTISILCENCLAYDNAIQEITEILDEDTPFSYAVAEIRAVIVDDCDD